MAQERFMHLGEITEHTLKSSNGTEKSEFSNSGSDLTSSKRRNIGYTSHTIVRETMKDVINLQQTALERIREKAEQQKSAYVTKTAYEGAIRKYENERLLHEKTKILLVKEEEKYNFALGEIEILKKHLEREKKAHEDLLKSVKQKAIRESQRGDLLYNKCTKIEETVEKQNDNICLKENEISDLKERLKIQRENHQLTMEDLRIQKAQEEYMARSLKAKEKRQRRGVS